MIYPYSCVCCPTYHETVADVEQYPGPQKTCPTCGGVTARRIYTPPQINTSDCQFIPHYNEGLGQVVYSKREIRNICKEQGLTETGTEKIPDIPRKRKKPRYDDVARTVQELGLSEEGREDLEVLKKTLKGT